MFQEKAVLLVCWMLVMLMNGKRDCRSRQSHYLQHELNRNSRLQPSGMYRHVVSFKYTDVSEVTAFIFRAMILSVTFLMMEVLRTSETSVYFNEHTRRYVPGDYILHTPLHENLKSHELCQVYEVRLVSLT
jgi:hypothetical protein